MIALSLIWYLLGLIVFYTFGQIGIDYWAEIYYVWDKAKDVLFIWAIYQLIKGKAFLWVLIFSIIRFVWEIFSLILGTSVNNEKAVAALFLILSILCLAILLRDVSKWRKQNLR